MKYLIFGQSNAQRLNGYAVDYFKSKLDCDAQIVAYGGSAAIQKNASASTPDNYWLTNDFVPNSMLVEARQAAHGCDACIFLQGEQDATRLLTYEQMEEYKKAIGYIFHYVGKPVFIVRTGRREGSDKRIGTHLVQLAQTMVAEENENISIACDSYDLDLVDNIHYSTAGQTELVNRLVDRLQDLIIK